MTQHLMMTSGIILFYSLPQKSGSFFTFIRCFSLLNSLSIRFNKESASSSSLRYSSQANLHRYSNQSIMSTCTVGTAQYRTARVYHKRDLWRIHKAQSQIKEPKFYFIVEIYI